ncbi:MAG: hypothetical protein QXX65_03785 [Candidatus Woesearchaeota archaeon]
MVVLLLASCQQTIAPQLNATPTQTECKPPYYEYTTGDCCLDSEPNKICDRYENRTLPQYNKTFGPQQPKSSVISDALAKYRQNTTGYSCQVNNVKYYVMSGLVHVKLDKMKRLEMKINNTIPVAITDIYIDRTSKEATGYCDPRTEKEIMGEYDPQRSPCDKLIDAPIRLDYSENNPVLPEDWLARFEHLQPTVVENTDQYVKDFTGWKAVNPVLHFVDNGIEYVLRLELKTGLPIKIEIREGPQSKIISFSNFVHNKVTPDQVIYQKFHK